MGQATCCDSSTNKKNGIEQNENNDVNNNNLVSSRVSERNKQLTLNQNPTNISGSINANENQIEENEQLNNANNTDLGISQNNKDNIGNSIVSLKKDESFNQNQNMLSGNFDSSIQNLNNKLSLTNSNASFHVLKHWRHMKIK